MMIFIAGASGFVGGHLIDALLKNGYKLRCLARSEKAEKALREKALMFSQETSQFLRQLKGRWMGWIS